jgi:hypothetical protein
MVSQTCTRVGRVYIVDTFANTLCWSRRRRIQNVELRSKKKREASSSHLRLRTMSSDIVYAHTTDAISLDSVDALTTDPPSFTKRRSTTRIEVTCPYQRPERAYK